MIAEKVETYAEMKRCSESVFASFRYFFATPARRTKVSAPHRLRSSLTLRICKSLSLKWRNSPNSSAGT